MLTYDQWDAVADSYTPILFFLSCARVAWLVRNTNQKIVVATHQGLVLIACLLWAYGLMFLDNALRIWPMLNLDYSTHTAVSGVFAVYLMQHNRISALIGAASLLAYFGLMRFQQYHSWMDIITTIAVVAPVCFVILKHPSRRESVTQS